jgi:hypothetical protein
MDSLRFVRPSLAAILLHLLRRARCQDGSRPDGLESAEATWTGSM